MDGRPESGVTLVEVLVSMAVASLTLAGAAGLLAVSARAVADGELETTAIWVASGTIEEWRSLAAPPLDGRHVVGLLEASWSARPDPAGAAWWRVTATVTARRLRAPVSAQALVHKVMP